MKLLALACLTAACGAPLPAPAPSAKPATPLSARAAPPANVRATRCSAVPSTVYGEEPVLFVIEGEGAAGTTLDAILYDARERESSRSVVAVPGQLKLAELPSGDFTLRLGTPSVSCMVTVNRELSRASSGRK